MIRLNPFKLTQNLNKNLFQSEKISTNLALSKQTLDIVHRFPYPFTPDMFPREPPYPSESKQHSLITHKTGGLKVLNP